MKSCEEETTRNMFKNNKVLFVASSLVSHAQARRGVARRAGRAGAEPLGGHIYINIYIYYNIYIYIYIDRQRVTALDFRMPSECGNDPRTMGAPRAEGRALCSYRPVHRLRIHRTKNPETRFRRNPIRSGEIPPLTNKNMIESNPRNPDS